MLKHHTAPEAHTAQGSEHTSHLLETSVPLSRKQETRAGGTHSEHHSTCFQEWRLGRQIFYLEQQKLVKDRKARSCIQPICFPLTTRHHKAVGIFFFSNKLTVMVDSYYYDCWGVRSHVIAPGTSNALICQLQQGARAKGKPPTPEYWDQEPWFCLLLLPKEGCWKPPERTPSKRLFKVQ